MSQPNNGEEALEITDTLVRSGAFDLVVVDSVAALTPKTEIEGDMGDSHMGLHARLMSQALRKLTANISRTHTLVIFINQIRMKIGVMFGCFDYDTRVMLADGSSEKIGRLVTQKSSVKVLSYNSIINQFESRPIINWYDNGETNGFLEFKVAHFNGKGFHRFACTANHQLLTPTGYQSAGEMKVGDKLMTSTPFEQSPLWNSLANDHKFNQPSLFINSLINNDQLDSVFESEATVVLEEVPPVLRAVPMPILEIKPKLPAQNRHRFDLEIDGNHNYVVDGVIVHNSPETTTGGNALKFYSSVRLDIRRIGGVKRGEDIIGNETRVKVAKNKVAPPFKETVFDIIYGEGISRESELIDLGTKYDIVDKSGAWYSYKGDNIGQGKDNARLYLKEHPEVADTIERQIREKLLPPKSVKKENVETKTSPENNKENNKNAKE